MFRVILLLVLLLPGISTRTGATELNIRNRTPEFSHGGVPLLRPPAEGLWSVALGWRDDWPDRWVHAGADCVEVAGEWTILHGRIELPEGRWKLRDAYRKEGSRVRCVRRWEWQGASALDRVTLSCRWHTPVYTERLVMPGILYFGNPSGYRNGGNMPTFGKAHAPEALFEEHRFPMPFVSAEIVLEGRYFQAALHSLPAPAPYAHIQDQWWSLGAVALESNTELCLLSGPVAWNGHRSYAKARQSKNDLMRYGDTYLNIPPGAVIEKTFFIEVSEAGRKGAAFMQAVDTSLDLFRPFYAGDMPPFGRIVRDKYRFALSRYIENERAAGFNMYSRELDPKFVFGWCGQAASPGYALQLLPPPDAEIDPDRMVQKSLDHLSGSPFNTEGFLLIYDVDKDSWSGQDPLSQGQGMYNFARAIQAARRNGRFDTSRWDQFLKRACDVHAGRVLSADWYPLSTNEAFLAAPLSIAYELFGEERYRAAAVRIADHYLERHLDMEEPYWGGTLDATGEDKEGAWAGFQAFYSLYELTGEVKYLDAAEHAAYVALSYTVVWDIPLPASRMASHHFQSRGWTTVSPQNMHLDVYGVFYTPWLYRLGLRLGRESLRHISLLMYRSCGQMIDPYGSHGEQLQHTNFAQAGDMSDIYRFRGGYVEHWTVFWVTAHFLHAAAQFMEIDPNLLNDE